MSNSAMYFENYKKLITFIKSYLNNEIDADTFDNDFESNYYDYDKYTDSVNLLTEDINDLTAKYQPEYELQNEYTLTPDEFRKKVEEIYKELENLTEEQIKGE